MKRLFVVLALVMVVLRVAAQEEVLQEGLALKYLVHQPTEKSKKTPVIVLLHGYGADEKDLFSLYSKFPGNYLVVSARAPYKLINGQGYQWYEIPSGKAAHVPKKEQVALSRETIAKFIGQVVEKYSADAKKVYLIGFSQGAIMSYEVALTTPGKVKGIAALSGRLIPDVKKNIPPDGVAKKLRIFIAHGTTDERISFADGRAAVEFLVGQGIEPEFHEYKGMGHTISNDELRDLVKWLK